MSTAIEVVPQPRPDDPSVEVVVLEIDGWAQTPLAVAYEVVVLADVGVVLPSGRNA